ncbi:Uncharacterized protein TCM_021851 [Theobroma cacao]|uniref:Uncharacterized protein n=1 Tax=Theobroma cacao TaxID=3641 RepID=A0A061ERC9_THECC|nr:Uncharacterized protein TCM_021851 [Theobroma cacao]
MRKPPSNTVISSFTRTAAVAVVYVTVLAWFCAEATAHETYQQHETPSRCQSLCPIQVMLHSFLLLTPQLCSSPLLPLIISRPHYYVSCHSHYNDL